MQLRQHGRATALLALPAIAAAAVAAAATASPASATYPPPAIHLLCTQAANSGTLEGAACVLPYGVTTAPNSYSATIAVGKVGAAGPSVTFAVTAGSLPPGLSLSAPSASADVITGNPTEAGTYGFTVKATDGGLTATQSYQITVTVQGPPDQLLCTPAGNGGFLVSGVCELPDAVLGLPYQGHLPTSHAAGGTLSVASGSLPPGLTLPATFTSGGDTISGTPATQGVSGYSFTLQGTGDQGQPLYQAYSIIVDQNVPLAINASGGTNLSPGTVGQPFAQNFFVSGGAAPYTWSLASGQLPPGLTLRTYSDPRDADNELAGTPTTAGSYTFTMRLSDHDGQQATQQFTLTIQP